MGMTRPRHAVDPIRVAVAAAVIMTLIVAGAILDTRRRIAAIPEPGRATPIEELREAWAEPDLGPRPRITIPPPHPAPAPENRP